MIVKMPIHVRVMISGPTGNAIFPFVVDTGATLTTMPEDVLSGLGVEKTGRITVVLANGEHEARSMGNADLEVVGLAGNRYQCPVVFMPVGAQPLLGIGALALMGLWVDTDKAIVVEENSVLLCGTRYVRGHQRVINMRS